MKVVRGCSAAERISRLCAGIAVTLISVFHLLGCAESSTFYYPSREHFLTPVGFEDVSFETSDGLMLHGWFMPAHGRTRSSPPGPAILHAHGNAGNVESHAGFSEFLTREGFSVLIFDYRGYGRSDAPSPPGRLDRHALYTDTTAALDYLLSRGDIDPNRIGAYGVSVGAAFALALAADRPEIRAVAEVSGFSTWKAIAGDHMPVIGPMLIPSGLDPIDSVARLGRRTTCPLLIVHGGADSIVRPYHAEAIGATAERAGVSVRKVLIPGGDHNEIIDRSEEARREIAAFFRQHL